MEVVPDGVGFGVEFVGKLGLFDKVLRPTFQRVSRVPLVSVVREEASIFGIGLEEETEEDSERDPICQVEVGFALLLELGGDRDGKGRDDFNVNPLAEAFAKAMEQGR